MTLTNREVQKCNLKAVLNLNKVFVLEMTEEYLNLVEGGYEGRRSS